MPARIVLISGAPGTGKTSISQMLAKNSTYDCAVNIHTDDFYQYIHKGYIAPWLDGTGDQNATVTEAIAASAISFSQGGYEVFVDGVIGPWFLNPWVKIAKEGIEVRYIVLRPNEEATVTRATEREQKDSFPLNPETVKKLWRSFSDLGQYESHAIDTSLHTISESAALIHGKLLEDTFRIL